MVKAETFAYTAERLEVPYCLHLQVTKITKIMETVSDTKYIESRFIHTGVVPELIKSN
jgi:hypothetical protein